MAFRQADPNRPIARTLVLRVLFGAVLLVLINQLAFSPLLYMRWIEPRSRLGMVMQRIDDLSNLPDDRRTVLVVGDSRIAEGFSSTAATETMQSMGRELRFASAGVPATTIRT